MPLKPEEIQVGAIAYFDVETLNNDSRVTKTGDQVTREGQFVCYKVDGSGCYWAPLTGTWKKVRLNIDPTWVVNGYGALKQGLVYLQDGKNTYSGLKDAFVEAAKNEEEFKNGRPSISSVGIEKIVSAIGKRGGKV